MRKIIFGCTLFLGGIIGSIGIAIVASFYPWNYNGFQGLLGSLLGTKLIIPWVIYCFLIIVGVIITFREVYLNE